MKTWLAAGFLSMAATSYAAHDEIRVNPPLQLAHLSGSQAGKLLKALESLGIDNEDGELNVAIISCSAKKSRRPQTTCVVTLNSGENLYVTGNDAADDMMDLVQESGVPTHGYKKSIKVVSHEVSCTTKTTCEEGEDGLMVIKKVQECQLGWYSNEYSPTHNHHHVPTPG